MRTEEQIKEHYEIEKRLACRLREANREERRILYSSLYDELFRLVPHHSQLARKNDPVARAERCRDQLVVLTPLLKKSSTFLEIGAGDCSVSIAVAAIVKEAIGVDVVDSLIPEQEKPSNFSFLKSDGLSIPLDSESVDFVYCNQLLEHLHPCDVKDLVKEVFRVLQQGGEFLCITPNKLYGPHDISRYFDKKATGFHLVEYSVGEASKLMIGVGFKKVRLIYNTKKRYELLPAIVGRVLELMAFMLNGKLRRKFLDLHRVQCLLGFKMVSKKNG